MHWIIKKHLYFVAGFFTLIIFSCSGPTGPMFENVTNIPSDKSLIYLYRPAEEINTEFTMTCNNEELCIMESGGYYPYFIDEGKVIITASVNFKMFATGLLDVGIAGTTDLVFEAELGKIYYLECKADELNGQQLTIRLVPENFGKIRVKECWLLPPITEEEYY